MDEPDTACLTHRVVHCRVCIKENSQTAAGYRLFCQEKLVHMMPWDTYGTSYTSSLRVCFSFAAYVCLTGSHTHHCHIGMQHADKAMI